MRKNVVMFNTNLFNLNSQVSLVNRKFPYFCYIQFYCKLALSPHALCSRLCPTHAYGFIFIFLIMLTLHPALVAVNYHVELFIN
jgi:hypothetical protein